MCVRAASERAHGGHMSSLYLFFIHFFRIFVYFFFVFIYFRYCFVWCFCSIYQTPVYKMLSSSRCRQDSHQFWKQQMIPARRRRRCDRWQ